MNRSRFLTGDIRHFSEHRTIVYLPPGYERHSNRTYPVLYLQDGQNVFDGETSFIYGQEWRVDETAEWMIRTGQIEPLIVAAIYNAGDARIDEYTPTIDRAIHRGGKADAYLNFLIHEIKPFIDRRFRFIRRAAGALCRVEASECVREDCGDVAVALVGRGGDHEADRRTGTQDAPADLARYRYG
jgi:enterochelin esterase-like enzyme